MTIKGYQFDKMLITPDKDALIYQALGGKSNRIIKKYKNEAKVTATGLNVYVGTGALLIFGRLIEITEEHVLTVPANSTGYIVVTVDLTQTNAVTGNLATNDYAPINNQLRLEVVTTLTQQDLMNEGKIYTYALASYTANGTSATVKKMSETDVPFEFANGFSNYADDQFVSVSVLNGVVQFDGGVKNSTSFYGGSDEITIFKIPENARPDRKIFRPQWGSSRNTFLLTVKTNGDVCISRYGVSESNINIPVGSWLNVGMSYRVKGA